MAQPLPADIPDDAIIGSQQMADRLGVHEKTVRRMINDGRLPGVRLSYRRVGVRAGDFRKWLAELPSTQDEANRDLAEFERRFKDAEDVEATQKLISEAARVLGRHVHEQRLSKPQIISRLWDALGENLIALLKAIGPAERAAKRK